MVLRNNVAGNRRRVVRENQSKRQETWVKSIGSAVIFLLTYLDIVTTGLLELDHPPAPGFGVIDVLWNPGNTNRVSH